MLIYIGNYLKSLINFIYGDILAAAIMTGLYRVFLEAAIFADLNTKAAGSYFQRLNLKLL